MRNTRTYQHPQPIRQNTIRVKHTMRVIRKHKHTSSQLDPYMEIDSDSECHNTNERNRDGMHNKANCKAHSQSTRSIHRESARSRDTSVHKALKPLLETESSVYLRLVVVVNTSCKQHKFICLPFWSYVRRFTNIVFLQSFFLYPANLCKDFNTYWKD